MSTKHLLAIPVFNEARYVLPVLGRAASYGTDILVIDDGSTDSTPKLLAEAGSTRVIRHPENRGYGASLASAFTFALDHGYSGLITMDCDEQHEPACIPRFMAALDAGDHDIISGSRYLAVREGDDVPPADRRRINGRITRMLNDRLGFAITDAFCGFKAYRVEALRHLRVTVPGYAMPMQFWVQVWRAGLRVTELPIPLIYNDPERHFGGLLDDPVSRYDHYIEVFNSAMRAGPTCCPDTIPCGVSAA